MTGHIDTWIFDLDETLYHPSAGLIAQINRRITGFIMRELNVTEAKADALREAYWRQYGTTLSGLVAEHKIDAEHFLDDCHQLDLDQLEQDPALATAIGALPGRRIIHTNGPRAHADRVLAARGLDQHFDLVISIEDTAHISKPDARAYSIALAQSGADARQSAMIEDKSRNLVVPKRLGMTTIWLAHERGQERPEHVDRQIECLTSFIQEISGARAP